MHRRRVTSYINNLHPVHDKYLYPFVEEIITAAIPLWERTLAPLNPERDEEMVGRRLPYNDVEYSIDADEWPEEDGPRQEIGEDETNFEDRRQEWIEDYRDLVIPEPGTFSQPLARPPPYSLREGFKERGLQVIVKLANIHLTPENPLYNGGSWHVEGQLVCTHRAIRSLYELKRRPYRTSTSSQRLCTTTLAQTSPLLASPSDTKSTPTTMTSTMHKTIETGFLQSLAALTKGLVFKKLDLWRHEKGASSPSPMYSNTALIRSGWRTQPNQATERSLPSS